MLSVKVDKTKVKLKRQAKMCVCRPPIQQKKGRKESVEDENKENLPPDDTKIPEREIKITSC